VRVEGVVPALSLRANAGNAVDLTLSAGPDGTVRAHVEVGPDSVARIDPGAPPPSPPYALTVSEAPGRRGCAVVWWEIASR
jgi:hypothetical protein